MLPIQTDRHPLDIVECNGIPKKMLNYINIKSLGKILVMQPLAKFVESNETLQLEYHNHPTERTSKPIKGGKRKISKFEVGVLTPRPLRLPFHLKYDNSCDNKYKVLKECIFHHSY